MARIQARRTRSRGAALLAAAPQPGHGGAVRWLPLLLVACAGPLPSEPGPVEECAETIQPLRSGERTPWGTTPNTVRVVLGPTEATWTGDDTTALTVGLEWPSGFTALIFATAGVEPDVAPPLWCTDRLEMPAVVRLAAADGRLDVDGEPVEIVGDLRAVGPIDDMALGFVGRVEAAVLPGLVPAGVEAVEHDLAVWVWWTRGEELTSAGRVRLVGAGSDELDVGEAVGRWD